MTERKVFNKYIPPDFDPSVLPKGERPQNGQIKIRSMLPMTICCTTCGEYMGRGLKYNARQEEVKGKTYLGLKLWRFYIKCTSCSSEMTFLTDPENDHYVTEHGCSTSIEPWRKTTKEEEVYKKKKEEEEKLDAMKKLENRSKDQKYQMDLMDSINDLQDINSKNGFANHDEVIKLINQMQDKAQKRAFENEIKDELQEYSASKKQKIEKGLTYEKLLKPSSSSSPNNIDNVDKILQTKISFASIKRSNSNNNNNKNNSNNGKNGQPVLIIKKKKKIQDKK